MTEHEDDFVRRYMDSLTVIATNPPRQCDHTIGEGLDDSGPTWQAADCYLVRKSHNAEPELKRFNFCPDCGEKLP